MEEEDDEGEKQMEEIPLQLKQPPTKQTPHFLDTRSSLPRQTVSPTPHSKHSPLLKPHHT